MNEMSAPVSRSARNPDAIHHDMRAEPRVIRAHAIKIHQKVGLIPVHQLFRFAVLRLQQTDDVMADIELGGEMPEEVGAEHEAEVIRVDTEFRPGDVE